MNVFLVFGVPTSGKSWVCEQLDPLFWDYIPHDQNTYEQILEAISSSTKDKIAVDVPFNERELRTLIEAQGHSVTPIAVTVEPTTVMERYYKRTNKPAPKNVLTRATSIQNKILEWKCFSGDSTQVLAHMRKL
jgi:hypothetical protein